jgi:anti-anti-sigma regulatory factor
VDITTDRPGGDVAVMRLDGELDGANFERVIAAARQLRDGGAKTLIVDLGGLTYMASAGLVALHSAAILMAGGEPPDPESGWDTLLGFGGGGAGDRMRQGLKLASTTPQVDRVLERTGIRSLFDVHPDTASALAAAGVTEPTA